MKSFRDPVTGVLKAWGYAEANGNDLEREEEDDFNLEPAKWQLAADAWVPYVDPEAGKRAAQAEIARLEDECKMIKPVRETHLYLMEKEARELSDTYGTPIETILSGQPFYVGLKAIHRQIFDLEKLLK